MNAGFASLHSRLRRRLPLPGLLLCLCALAVSGVGICQDPVVVTSAGGVHNLPGELASRAQVRFKGTITYYDSPELIMFVQDETGGVFVNVDHAYPFRAGQTVSVAGGARKSYRTEVAPNPAITLAAAAKPLHPVAATYADLASGKMDCRLVSVQGIVRDAVIEFHPQSRSNTLHMNLSLRGGEVEVYVKDFTDIDPISLLGAEIHLSAVAGGGFDTKDQLKGIMLYVPGSKEIRILSHPQVSPLNLPLTDISDVFSTLRTDDSSPRLHVRGTIVYYASGDSVVLEHEGRSLYVQTRETKSLSVGEVVDAYGFADNHNYSPSLRQAVLIPTGQTERIAAVPVSYEMAMSGMFSDQLISIEGTLVSQLRTPELETITLNVDGRLIRGTIPSLEHLLDLPIGSRIRLSGVCRIVTGGPWREPVLFSVASRTPADIRIISTASWWTVRHLAFLLGALLIAALLIALWACLLRIRIKGQSKQIKRSMEIARSRSRILERISNNDPLLELLEEMAKLAMDYLPGTSVQVKRPADAQNNLSETDRTLFHCPIEDGGEPIGALSVHGWPQCTKTEADEVTHMLRELIALAVRQRALHNQLVHHSTHDPLTNLPNRRLSEQKINEELASASTNAGKVSIVYIDVDRFKAVNDKHGHRIGDLYLQSIGRRITEQLRVQDVLARVGGDEFVVLIPGVGLEDARSILERLQNCFDLPFILDGTAIQGSASFGLASYPDHGGSREELERHADNAMYLAKRNRHGKETESVSSFTTADLECALERDLFRLDYQPQFSLSGELTGLEALVRLEDPLLGTLTPQYFITVAESSDFIVDLGDWVLRAALRDADRWRLADQHGVVLAVNIAARQLEQEDFASRVLGHLAESRFPAGCLELELTERTLLSKTKEVLRQVELLTQHGVRISLDDFGTEHSCLSLLHRLPIHTVKIDRSFIKALKTESRAIHVVEAIVNMADCLGMRVVSEGIEDPQSIAQLRRFSAMEYQGYWLSRPVSAADVAPLLPAWLRGVSTLADPEAYS